MKLRQLALLLSFAIVAGCTPGPGSASTVPPSRTTTVNSGIEGIVLAGPTCPVQRAGESPCVRPIAAAVLVVTDPTGAEVARTTTDSAGRFRIALPGGTYTIRPQPVSGVLGTGREQVVAVLPAAFTPVTIEYDTGIR